MPTWLKVGTGVVAVLLVGVIAFGAYWAIRLQGNLTKAAAERRQRSRPRTP